MTTNRFIEWEVESLRLSLFYLDDIVLQGLWEEVMGQSPENVEAKPRERMFQEYGLVEGDRVICVSQPQRLDWHIQPDISPREDLAELRLLAHPEEALALCERALPVSLNALRHPYRVAFGVVLISPVNSPQDGMQQLDKYLPYMQLAERGGTNFVFQINRRRHAPSAQDVIVNRISTWRVDKMQTGDVKITVPPAKKPLIDMDTEERYINRLIVDINTAPENNAIAKLRMPALLTDCMQFAYEIARDGDVL